MGGDIVSILNSSTGEESYLDQEFAEHSHISSNFFNEDALSSKVNSGSMYGEADDFGQRPSKSVVFEANQRRIRKVYDAVLRSYDDLQRRSEHLEEAKRKILSYTPGSWIEKVSGTTVSDYAIPKTTSILLVGPKGSGKSSLVNKVSRVFEDNIFTSERAQVSYNSYVGDGTYFIQEYMMPRGSGAFSLYDTRSLSDESSESLEILEHWMRQGVRHGELVLRDSDSLSVKTRMKCKARLSNFYSGEARMINFVIFVVNGLSVLDALDSDDNTKKEYTEMISTLFNCPFLSLRDDRPVVVVTHGDLLSMSDRIRVRIHLGGLLGIPPHRQIFDIPESDDLAAELAIIDMIRYCLERADRNLPCKGWFKRKIHAASLSVYLFLLMLAIALIFAYVLHYTLMHGISPLRSSIADSYELHSPPSDPSMAADSCELLHSSIADSYELHSPPWDSSMAADSYDWHKIRHFWLGED